MYTSCFRHLSSPDQRKWQFYVIPRYVTNSICHLSIASQTWVHPSYNDVGVYRRRNTMEIEMPVPSQGRLGVQVRGGHQSAPPPSCQLIFDSSQVLSKVEKKVQRGKIWRMCLLKLINRGNLPPGWRGYLHSHSSVPWGENNDSYRINQISPTHRKTQEQIFFMVWKQFLIILAAPLLWTVCSGH